MTEDDLWELFEDIDGVSKVKLVTDRDTGESKGIAFVDFNETEDVDKAMKKQGEKGVTISYNQPKGDKGKDGKGKGKDGKGKGKDEKGKDGDASAAKAKTGGAIQEFAGKKV